MPVDLLIALIVFACVMAFTPGPNNIMLAAWGVNFGFAHTIPHMLGVAIGFDVLLVAFAAGLGLVFAAVPQLHLPAQDQQRPLYMLWLAWKVTAAQYPTGDAGGGPARPFTFLQAAAFQWINPKAVVASLSAITLYVRPGHLDGDFPAMLLVMTVATVGWS